MTFATIGARLFRTTHPRSILMPYVAGGDFPSEVSNMFEEWPVETHVLHRPEEPSARGRVSYAKDNTNRKSFLRLTKPLPFDVIDLQPHLSQINAYHFFGTPAYLESQTLKIFANFKGPQDRPWVAWEPEAKSCRPDTLAEHAEAARRCNVFSPNHLEIHSFFGESHPSGHFDRAEVERDAEAFLQHDQSDNPAVSVGGRGCIIVRAAEHGCLFMNWEKWFWMPAYYPADSAKIVDPTGCGNAFLGGFLVGLQIEGRLQAAVAYGAVAASFVIEQVGVPERMGTGEEEKWNGDSVWDRLDRFQGRLAAEALQP